MTLQLLAILIFAMLGTAQADITSVTFKDAVTHGVVSVRVGSPPTEYSLMLDLASANTWVGAGKSYVSTSTTSQTGQTVMIHYGKSDFSGNEYNDLVILSPGLVVSSQSIGVIESTPGFTGVDGILGLGPTALSVGTLSPDSTAAIPTVTDNLFSQGPIPAQEIGISAQPSTGEGDEYGEITFGGVDSSKFTGCHNSVYI